MGLMAGSAQRLHRDLHVHFTQLGAMNEGGRLFREQVTAFVNRQLATFVALGLRPLLEDSQP